MWIQKNLYSQKTLSRWMRLRILDANLLRLENTYSESLKNVWFCNHRWPKTKHAQQPVLFLVKSNPGDDLQQGGVDYLSRGHIVTRHGARMYRPWRYCGCCVESARKIKHKDCWLILNGNRNVDPLVQSPISRYKCKQRLDTDAKQMQPLGRHYRAWWKPPFSDDHWFQNEPIYSNATHGYDLEKAMKRNNHQPLMVGRIWHLRHDIKYLTMQFHLQLRYQHLQSLKAQSIEEL